MDIYEPLYLLHLYDVYLSPELYLYFFSQLPNFDVLFIKIARLNTPPHPAVGRALNSNDLRVRVKWAPECGNDTQNINPDARPSAACGRRCRPVRCALRSRLAIELLLQLGLNLRPCRRGVWRGVLCGGKLPRWGACGTQSLAALRDRHEALFRVPVNGQTDGGNKQMDEW